jgi:hypothetical protein
MAGDGYGGVIANCDVGRRGRWDMSIPSEDDM